MFNRRKLITGVPLIAMGGGLIAGCETKSEQSNKAVNNLDDSFARSRGFVGEVFETPDNGAQLPVGMGASRHTEVTKAFRLLWDAPRTSNHMEIAEYFLNISDVNPDERNAAGDVAAYNEEWARRANPLITAFFGMTNTLPSSGDQTAWCAAFVSFVLYAAGKPNKFSALSGSYRSYARMRNLENGDEPRAGDILVLRKNGPKGDLGFGHVGFYTGVKTETAYEILGGNQRAGEGSTGAVTKTMYRKNGSYLSLHSFRIVPEDT